MRNQGDVRDRLERVDRRTRSSDASRSPSTKSKNDKRAISAAARQPDGRAVPQRGVQLEPHRQLVARQRGARRLQPDHDRDQALDWAGIGNANATFGIAGGQPIPGLSSIGWGSGLTTIGAGASDTDTLDKTYQINEKLTWLKGRHSLKFGGQLLHYVQRRFYAGNNGLLGLFGYGGAFTGFAFSDFLLDQVASKGRGSVSEPWTHLHNRIALFVQDDFKVDAGAHAQPRACGGRTRSRSSRRTTVSRISI